MSAPGVTPPPASVSSAAPAPARGGAPVSLLASFSWALAGRLAYLLSQWGVLVVLARWGTPELVGQFGLALALTTPPFMLAQLGLRDLYATERDGGSFAVFLTLRLLSTALALGVMAAVAVGGGYAAPVALAIVVVALAKAAENVSDVLLSTLQRAERMDLVGRSFFLRGLLSVAGVAAAMAAFGTLAAAVMALAASWLLTLVAYDAPLVARHVEPQLLRVEWNGPRLRTLAVLALPLGLVAMLSSLQTNVARYLLEAFSGAAALGYFTAIVATVSSLDLVVVAMTRAALARLGALHGANVAHFWRLLMRLAGLGALLGVAALAAGALFGRELLTLVYGREYGEYVQALLWLLVGRVAVFVYTYVKAAQVVMRRLRRQLAVSVASVCLGVACGVLLIPRWGINGAAMTVAATQWIALVIGAATLGASNIADRRDGEAVESAAS